ncbi:hypothetical protein HK098_003911 [Nowakowskiella sp. JEL0407]|nr:hypothetical protein HK098_003911 [Nowakowskiella sp. JEL0407]
MSSITQATKLLADAKSLIQQNKIADAGKILAQLKIHLTELTFLIPSSKSVDNKELLLCREILETGVQWSIKAQDIPAFERYISQLKTYYSDYSSILPPSPLVYPLLGLNLLRLLSQNRISDFHTELEQIQPDQLSNKFIKHPVEIEQCLMEGSYNKVWNSRASCPGDEYLFFFDILMGTIRDEIASCSEKTYQNLPLSDAATLLYLKSTDEVKAFAEERGWIVKPDEKKIYFVGADNDASEIPTAKVIRQTLGYARELERIVRTTKSSWIIGNPDSVDFPEKIRNLYHLILINPNPIAQLKSTPIPTKFSASNLIEMSKVVIVGGSNAGLNVLNELITKSAKAKIKLEITLIEKRSHYQHTYGMVRGVVDEEFSKQTWVSFSNYFSDSGPGKGHNFVQGEVSAVYEKKVVLADGKEIEFDYLVYATGSLIPAPYRPIALNPEDGLKENSEYTSKFASAKRIAFIGGGPISVETVGEIKERFPDKEITIITATEYLLGAKVGGTVDPKPAKTLQDKLTKLGVKVITNEKVDIAALGLDKEGQALYEGEKTIQTSKGEIISDLQVVAVGGYKPISGPIKTLGDVLDSRGFVKVKATLQLESESHSHIFSLGDVAATGATKMGMSIMGQSPVVSDNIIALITKKPLKLYDSNGGMKGMMVTLGKTDGITYMHFFGGITVGGWMVRNTKGPDFMMGRIKSLLAVK